MLVWGQQQTPPSTVLSAPSPSLVSALDHISRSRLARMSHGCRTSWSKRQNKVPPPRADSSRRHHHHHRHHCRPPARALFWRNRYYRLAGTGHHDHREMMTQSSPPLSLHRGRCNCGAFVFEAPEPDLNLLCLCKVRAASLALRLGRVPSSAEGWALSVERSH